MVEQIFAQIGEVLPVGEAFAILEGCGGTTAFWAILGSFVLLIVGMLGFFRFKRWL